MKKKFCSLFLILLLAAGSVLTVHAEELIGGKGWYVRFTGNKMESNFNSSDVAEAISKMEPGDSVTFRISLENNDTSSTDWYMTNEVLQSLEDSQKVLPAFEKWAKRNLSSGGVRTFVHMDSFESGDDLIKQMKRGHMTLSDGPLFFPVMERTSFPEDSPAFPGDRVSVPGDIQVKLYTNRRLKTIRLLKKGRQAADYSLAPYEKDRRGYMDYSHRLTIEMLKDMGMEWKKEDYLVMIAFDDCTNLAIANPFFVI